MKANPSQSGTVSRILSLAALSTATLLAACVPAPQPPARAPAPRPAPNAPVAPTPATPVARDWRDMPLTPGDWQWGRTAGGSSASFAGGQFVMRCDPSRQIVTLLRAGSAASSRASMLITTSDTARTLTATPVTEGIAVALNARDPLLDAMAFSRGRFMVTVDGTAPLYVPSWTEISRVIEDCR